MLRFVFIIISLACSQALEFEIKTVSLASVNTASESRIIGGSPVSIQQYPYTVQILYNSRLYCGGSLLTQRHVLSAAHCFVDTNNNIVSPQSFSIRAGSATLNTGGSVYGVSALILHERYNVPLRDNDVAVMVLSARVQLSNTVDIAFIPQQGEQVRDNATVIHVGWGRTHPEISTPSIALNGVAVRTVNLAVCAERYALLQNLTGQPYPVTSNMLCAGLLDIGGADACQGDSGGPLIYGNVVVGITSWGYGCAEPLFPGVNARVSSYTNWINATVMRYNAGPPLPSLGGMLLLFSILISAGATKISLL